MEDCDDQVPPDPLESSEQQIQEIPIPSFQDSAVFLSEGEVIGSPQTEQHHEDMRLCIEGEFVITQNIHIFIFMAT